MGHVYVNARVSARKSATVRFLVDTGATWTVVPPALARRVGAPMLPQRFRLSLADGRKRLLRVCAIGVKLGDREGAAVAVIMPGGEPLLGIETLEALGLKVNPNKGRLEPSRPQAALLVGVRPRR